MTARSTRENSFPYRFLRRECPDAEWSASFLIPARDLLEERTPVVHEHERGPRFVAPSCGHAEREALPIGAHVERCPDVEERVARPRRRHDEPPRRRELEAGTRRLDVRHH